MFTENTGISSTDKKQSEFCLRCGLDLKEAKPSKFDAKYCVYCQNQKTGKFEESNYNKIRDYLINIVNRIVTERAKETMDPKEAEEIAVQLIRENPRIISMDCLS